MISDDNNHEMGTKDIKNLEVEQRKKVERELDAE